MSKIADSQNNVRKWANSKNPCVLCSFGKDSMVLLHLIRSAGLNLPVVYHRNHWFPEKNAFADSVIQLWQLQVHDWPPSECGIKVHDDCIQTVNQYQVSPTRSMHMPNGILEPEEGKPWICGRFDILDRPKGTFVHPWDLMFSGHKGGDEDIFEGPWPLKTDYVYNADAPDFCFPLKEWSDGDVWDYIDEFNVPIQTTRYDVANRIELEDKRFNNDYVRACMKCIDPRQPQEVFCPKFNKNIPNVSHLVKNMEQKFDYIAA
jgi:hypothetical protein